MIAETSQESGGLQTTPGLIFVLTRTSKAPNIYSPCYLKAKKPHGRLRLFKLDAIFIFSLDFLEF